MKLVSTSPFVEECRRRYQESPAYRQTQEVTPAPSAAAPILPRQPIEYRADMSVEDYERWIEEQASP